MSQPVVNRTLFTGDNLPILRGFNSACIDLIYLDPPFNSNQAYAAPVGSAAAGASFKDAWTLSDEDDAWHAALKSHHPKLYAIIHATGAVGGRGDKSYLIYMAIRLLEMCRVLKDTGSIYLHIDPTMSHSLKLVMDAIFGSAQFVNEIIWYYKNASRGKKRLANSHDVIFWYAKTDPKFNRDDVLVPFDSGMTEWRHNKAGKPPPKGKTPDDVFTIPALNTMAKERTGYPTQKPLALLERIVRASSDAGDMVLDPFCGSTTTCVSAEVLNRNWVGIDTNPKALEMVKKRLAHEVLGAGRVFDGKVIHRTDLPLRTDIPRIRHSKPEIKEILYSNQVGVCNGCDEHFPIRNSKIDHIVPKKEGGGDVLENFQLLCEKCNHIKGNGNMKYLKVWRSNFITHDAVPTGTIQ